MFGLQDVKRMPVEEDRISLSELIGFDEDLIQQGLDLDADANAGLPPVPKGAYICRAQVREGVQPNEAWVKKITEKGQSYLATSPDLVIITDKDGDPQFEGRKISPFVMTLLMSGTGTTGVQAFAQGAGANDAFKTLPNHSDKAQALFLNDLLASQPIIGVNVDWSVFQRAEDNKDGKKFTRRGMDKFPKDDSGNSIPIWILEDGTELNARNDVKSYFQVSEELQTEEAPVVETVKASAPRAAVATKQAAPAPAPAPVAATSAAPTPQARRATPQRRTA